MAKKKHKEQHQKEESKQEPGAPAKSIKGDLDALFKNKKSKAIKKPEKTKPVKIVEQKPDKKEADKKKPRKYTEDGLKIYTMDELKIGLGGDTPDCPFDCNCCF